MIRKIIIGLGNPGTRYAKTRHNIGFLAVDRLAQRLQIPIDQKSSHAEWGKASVGEVEIVLAKPQTFMNRSGQAVRAIIQSNPVEIRTDFLVILDDLDLPFGRIRLRSTGSSAGHRGIESISEFMETIDFPRLRIGIDHPEGAAAEQYVLEKFTAEEAQGLEEVLDRAVGAAILWYEKGCEEAMNRYNH